MKLSMEIYVLRERFGDRKAIEMIKKAGFDAIDYSYYWFGQLNSEQAALGEKVLGDSYKEYAYQLRSYLDVNGIECNQVHTPFDIQYGESFDESNPHYRDIVRSLESASILGAKCAIVHSITVPDMSDVSCLEKYNIEFYKSLIPYCEKFNICLAVENLFGRDKKRDCFSAKLGTPESLARVIKGIDSPYAVACIDIGHAALTGFEPQTFIRAMGKDIVKALHVQDNDYHDDRHVLPFMGDLNWDEIMSALKEIEYDGELTLEIFKYLNRFPNELIPEALSFAKKISMHLISKFERN